MKIGMFLGVIGISFLGATPNRYERTTENILGSGADGFVVIRLEVVNPGSYYSREEKTSSR